MNSMRSVMENVLRTADRSLLVELAACVPVEAWTARGLSRPDSAMGCATQESAWLGMVNSPEDPPAELVDALLGVREMARYDRADTLRHWLCEAGFAMESLRDASVEDLALRLWLRARDRFREKHSMARMATITAFVYFGRNPDEDHRGPDRPEVMGSMGRLRDGLDEWYAEHGRGVETAVITCIEQRGELYHAIRHGDTLMRVAGVKRRDLDIIGFRPAKDDLVIYNPDRDELRINARTLGEEDLCRRLFGAYLRQRARITCANILDVIW